MPPLSALSPQPSFEKTRNYDPVLGAELAHFLLEKLVFFSSPLGAGLSYSYLVFLLDFILLFRFLCGFTTFLFELKISFEASYLCFLRHESAKPVPGCISVDLDEAKEFFVLKLVENESYGI